MSIIPIIISNPVIDKELSMIPEVDEMIEKLGIPAEKIWAMPAGDDRESLMGILPYSYEFCQR